MRDVDARGAALVERLWPIEEPPAPPRPGEAAPREIRGFEVLVDRKALGHAETKAALDVLDEKLAELAIRLPAGALPALRRSRIVLRWAAVPEERAQLITHNGVIDILNTRAYVRSLSRHPDASGAYDHVSNKDGKRGRAYAMTNATEYFAELSVAYFGTCFWFPFTREDLRGLDRDGFDLVARLGWRRARPRVGRSGGAVSGGPKYVCAAMDAARRQLTS